ncbi:MAG: DUF2232 domain-containing protein [Bacteriovoracaceae bacterium]
MIDQENLTNGKLLFLGLTAMALCAFGPLSLFASVPLTIAVLLYGRQKSLVLVLGFMLFSVALSMYMLALSYMPFAYFFSAVIGVLNAEVILRKWHPVKGLLTFGLAVVGVIFVLLLGVVILEGGSITGLVEAKVLELFEQMKLQNKELISAGGEQARLLEDFLSDPKAFAKDIINWMPSVIFITIFFTFWATLFLVLRNSLLWKIRHAYPYTVKELVHFKVPDVMLWPLILALTLRVAGDYIWGDALIVLGSNLLYGIGLFYFFQGFGLYITLLDYLRIRSFLRTFLVLLTVTMAWQIVVLFGVFDGWINFRKFLRPKTGPET